jgi:hypothetical protein
LHDLHFGLSSNNLSSSIAETVPLKLGMDSCIVLHHGHYISETRSKVVDPFAVAERHISCKKEKLSIVQYDTYEN